MKPFTPCLQSTVKIQQTNYICLVAALLFGIFLSLPAAAQDEDEAAKAKIELEPLIYTLVKYGRPKAQVTVRVGLQIMTGVAFEPINNRVPQVRSDFLTILAALATQRFKVTRPVDPTLIQAYFQQAADRRLGANQVKIFVLDAGIKPM